MMPMCSSTVNGYFAPSTASNKGFSLQAFTPCRIMDSRNIFGAFSGTLVWDMTSDGPCGQVAGYAPYGVPWC